MPVEIIKREIFLLTREVMVYKKTRGLAYEVPLLFIKKISPSNYGCSRAGHVNEIFLTIPENLQITTEQFDSNRFVFIYQSVQG